MKKYHLKKSEKANWGVIAEKGQWIFFFFNVNPCSTRVIYRSLYAYDVHVCVYPCYIYLCIYTEMHKQTFSYS